MLTDSLFVIGSTHQVCQDYSLTSEDLPEWPCFALLSDGCSSSKNTDVGARMIVLAAYQEQVLFGQGLVSGPRSFIERVQKNSPVKNNSLDATLLMLNGHSSLSENGTQLVQGTAYGDGFFFGLRKDGRVEFWQIDQGDAPAYLSNLLQWGRLQRYLEKWGGKCSVRHWLDGELVESTTTQILVTPGTEGPDFQIENFGINLRFDLDQYKMLGIGSDGLDSFKDRDLNRVSPVEVLKCVCDITVARGTFVQRNVGHFLKKECPKLGWKHDDDVSVAAIWLED